MASRIKADKKSYTYSEFHKVLEIIDTIADNTGRDRAQVIREAVLERVNQELAVRGRALLTLDPATGELVKEGQQPVGKPPKVKAPKPVAKSAEKEDKTNGTDGHAAPPKPTTLKLPPIVDGPMDFFTFQP